MHQTRRHLEGRARPSACGPRARSPADHPAAPARDRSGSGSGVCREVPQLYRRGSHPPPRSDPQLAPSVRPHLRRDLDTPTTSATRSAEVSAGLAFESVLGDDSVEQIAVAVSYTHLTLPTILRV